MQILLLYLSSPKMGWHSEVWCWDSRFSESPPRTDDSPTIIFGRRGRQGLLIIRSSTATTRDIKWQSVALGDFDGVEGTAVTIGDGLREGWWVLIGVLATRRGLWEDCESPEWVEYHGQQMTHQYWAKYRYMSYLPFSVPPPPIPRQACYCGSA